MGVYNTVEFASAVATKAAGMVEYLNTLNGVTAEAHEEEGTTGFLFSLDTTDIVGYYGWTPDRATRYWLKNGDNYLIPVKSESTYGGQAAFTVHSYVDDNLILISFRDRQAYREGMEFALLTIGNTRIIGYKANTAHQENPPTYLDISELTFEEIGDAVRITYGYTNMFPYAAPIGQLDFVNQAYFVNGNNVKKFTTSFLKECSIVNLLSSASLPSPLGNFIAIGAHCLAPLDPEGGNE